ncbi:biotin-dependent carboxyltransferase family protein [Pelagibacterium sediminicola]|uniref:5-oxoprolinase subunit C family protein n=1 Tax=Pelagibacterium sediminicola TaxID=2248761 RepID=UPI000E320B31|nr:biotin-dependent carboxyltransferase family protein [Pelagibacterium sediminicola]
MSTLTILRAGPLVTVQDLGRPGQLIHGISASGALDRSAYRLAGALAGKAAGAALEFTSAGLGLRYSGTDCTAGFAGGQFGLTLNGEPRQWPLALNLTDGDVIDITTGPWGNYGYIRFEKQIDCAPVMGSRSTNAVVGLGGYEGRALRAGDELALVPLDGSSVPETIHTVSGQHQLSDPIRVTWSVHADLFPETARSSFISTQFQITARMDRMGVRLKDAAGVFTDANILSLVSDSIVPGDIQILGDGTPIVLLRDHQPTGGYPRIATVISADLDRFAQIRSGRMVRFQPVTVEAAQAALKGTL